MTTTRGVTIGLSVLLGIMSGSAMAQSVDDQTQDALGQKKESVRKQKEKLLPPDEALSMKDKEVAPDAYQAKGIDLGNFMLMPKAEVDLIRNSNIYAQNYNPKFDLIHVYRPEVALNSRFDRHSITATLRGEEKQYTRYSKENTTNVLAVLGGRYDLSDQNTLNANLSYVQDHEDRGSPDDAGGLRPTEYRYATVDLSGTFKTGYVTSTIGFSAVNRQWSDTETSVGITPSHYRNRNEYELKVREGYEFIPGYSVFTEIAGLQRRYIQDTDQFGVKRDSDGIRAGTGLALDVSDLIRGDFQFGYMQQNYEAQSLKDPSGYFARARFNWTPTKLTSVLPTVERSIEETTANGVTALMRTSFGVTVRHELQRNIILGSTVSYSLDEQKGGGLTAKTYDGTLRATYLFDRNFYTSAELEEKHKLTNVDGSGFNQTTALLRFGVQY